MPIIINNLSVQDEFISGTTNIVQGNVSDKFTIIYDLEFQNVIDAQGNGSYRINAFDGGDVNSQYIGKQAFEINSALLSFISIAQKNELSQAFGAEITASGFSGAINGTYTIATYSQGIIYCNESYNASFNATNGRLALTDIISDCEIEYRFSGTGNNNSYIPAIYLGNPQNNGLVPTFKTSTTSIGATNPAVIDIPFLYDGAYKTGEMTIQGQGLSQDIQSFQLIHKIKAVPISIYYNGNFQPQNYSGARQAIGNVGNVFGNNTKYGLRGSFATQSNGGIRFFFDTQTDIFSEIVEKDTKYGAGKTDYLINNLSFERTSDSEPSSVPLVETKFSVQYDIENTQDNPFSDFNTKVKIGIDIPSDILLNDRDYEQQFLNDELIVTLGDAPASGTATGSASSITNAQAVFNSSSSVTVSFDVELTAAAKNKVLASSKYWFVFYAVTQNHLLDHSNSDRVILYPFEGEAILNIVDEEPVNTNFGIIEFPETEITVSIASAECYPADNLVAKNIFNLDWTDRDNLRINNINNKIILKNTVTDEVIELDSNSIAVSGFPLIDNKYPAANFSQNRGYQIPFDEVRNNITLINRQDLDSGDVHYFELNYPFKVKHQYWKKLIISNVPSELIDTNEPNDGINQFWYRLQTITDWRVFHRIEFEMNEGVSVFTQTFDNQLTLYDYESNIHSVSYSLKAYTEDGLTELTDGSFPLIDKESKTMIVASLELDETVADFEVEIFGERKEKGSDTTIQRISSINNRKNGSVFQGITDVNFIDKEINSNFVIGKALADGERIGNDTEFELYAKYYIALNKITESGELKETQSGENKIID